MKIAYDLHHHLRYHHHQSYLNNHYENLYVYHLLSDVDNLNDEEIAINEIGI